MGPALCSGSVQLGQMARVMWPSQVRGYGWGQWACGASGHMGPTLCSGPVQVDVDGPVLAECSDGQCELVFK